MKVSKQPEQMQKKALPEHKKPAHREMRIFEPETPEFVEHYAGNAFVQHLAFGKHSVHVPSQTMTLPLQTKLTVNQPSDIYEQEADQVAEQVMRIPMSSGQTLRRCACGGIIGPDGECEACKAKRLGLQRKPADIPPIEASPSVYMTLKRAGQSLDAATRGFMEGHFGQDFSGVRVHTDAQAAQSAIDMNAKAYTVGQNVVFGQGQYTPRTREGQKLIAHELTHVVQQKTDTTSRLARQAQETKSDPSSANSPQQTIPRPPAVPLDASVVLQPITLPPKLLAVIPEGKVTKIIPPAPPILMGNYGTLPDISVGPPVAATGAALVENAGSTLRTFGFKSAPGGNAIGMIGFPGKGLGWGHTAVYVRVNGKIIVTRGFMPASLVEAFLKRRSVKAGESSIPGEISNDSGAFMRDAAQTVEWPVSEMDALQAAADLPKTGVPPEGSPTRYTARPGVRGIPRETNCVGFGCAIVEPILGDKVGTEKLGPIMEPVNPATEGLQGRFMKASGENFGELNPMRNAIGPGVRAKMPTSLTVLKWGGRVFLVAGGVLAIVAVVRAPEEEKARVAAVEGGGFLAGFAVGAAAGLFCGPGALVCSIVLGLGFGIAGSLVGRQISEVIYDEAVGDDEAVREWLSRHTPDDLSRQRTETKIQMILALMAGWISGDDVRAIGQICQSVKTGMEANIIRNVITPHIVPNMSSIGQRTQVRVYLANMPK